MVTILVRPLDHRLLLASDPAEVQRLGRLLREAAANPRWAYRVEHMHGELVTLRGPRYCCHIEQWSETCRRLGVVR